MNVTHIDTVRYFTLMISPEDVEMVREALLPVTDHWRDMPESLAVVREEVLGILGLFYRSSGACRVPESTIIKLIGACQIAQTSDRSSATPQRKRLAKDIADDLHEILDTHRVGNRNVATLWTGRATSVLASIRTADGALTYTVQVSVDGEPGHLVAFGVEDPGDAQGLLGKRVAAVVRREEG